MDNPFPFDLPESLRHSRQEPDGPITVFVQDKDHNPEYHTWLALIRKDSLMVNTDRLDSARKDEELGFINTMLDMFNGRFRLEFTSDNLWLVYREKNIQPAVVGAMRAPDVDQIEKAGYRASRVLPISHQPSFSCRFGDEIPQETPSK